jgi:hypothetical protein
MKGIATMSPADFQSEYSSQTGLAYQSRPALQLLGQDHVLQNENGQAANGGSAAKPQSGFLNQSIDEIARLYVESPFSW